MKLSGIIVNMKKTIILFSIILLSSNFVFAETPVQYQLNKIEQDVWGFNYDKETDIERIERIEKQIFGKTNPQIAPEKRIDKITKSLGIETYEEAKSSLSDLYVQEKEGAGVEYPQIDALEKILLSKTYKNENIYVRLERLEKKVFGAKQEGELSQRTEALKNHAQVAMNNQKLNFDGVQSYSQADRTYSQSSDIKLQLAAIENLVFSTDFSNEPIPLRLNRLENRIFQRDFSDDDEQTRISRLQAAATASKTAKYYDNNKFQKFATTGMQAASFLLMLLAFIL